MWNFQHTRNPANAGRIPSPSVFSAHVFSFFPCIEVRYFVIVEFFELFVSFFKSYVKTALCVSRLD